MKNEKKIVAFVLTGILSASFVGCDKKDAAPVVPTNPPPVQPQAAAPMAGDKTAPMMAAPTMNMASTADAQKLLDQAMQYIKENKWDLADSTIKKLEEMKATLPADWAAKIDQARSAFNTAKGASNMMPSMPAMPK